MAACPSQSLACEIPNFNSSTSSRSQVVETGCISGWVLSVEGKCLESCSAGEFTVGVGTNVTCSACNSSCGTCQNEVSYCLACSASNQVAFEGRCSSDDCPAGTVMLNGTCWNCHQDCERCSGTVSDVCLFFPNRVKSLNCLDQASNQCASCPADRPVLKDGRCLCVCEKNEYFNTTLGSCDGCDCKYSCPTTGVPRSDYRCSIGC